MSRQQIFFRFVIALLFVGTTAAPIKRFEMGLVKDTVKREVNAVDMGKQPALPPTPASFFEKQLQSNQPLGPLASPPGAIEVSNQAVNNESRSKETPGDSQYLNVEANNNQAPLPDQGVAPRTDTATYSYQVPATRKFDSMKVPGQTSPFRDSLQPKTNSEFDPKIELETMSQNQKHSAEQENTYPQGFPPEVKSTQTATPFFSNREHTLETLNALNGTEKLSRQGSSLETNTGPYFNSQKQSREKINLHDEFDQGNSKQILSAERMGNQKNTPFHSNLEPILEKLDNVNLTVESTFATKPLEINNNEYVTQNQHELRKNGQAVEYPANQDADDMMPTSINGPTAQAIPAQRESVLPLSEMQGMAETLPEMNEWEMNRNEVNRQDEQMQSYPLENGPPFVGENMMRQPTEWLTSLPQATSKVKEHRPQGGVAAIEGNKGRKPESQETIGLPPGIQTMDKETMQKLPDAMATVTTNSEAKPFEFTRADSPQVLTSMDENQEQNTVRQIPSPQGVPSLGRTMLQTPPVQAMPTVNEYIRHLTEFITASPLGIPTVDESKMLKSREEIPETDHLHSPLPFGNKEAVALGKVTEKPRNIPLKLESMQENTLEKQYNYILNNAYTAAEYEQSVTPPNPIEINSFPKSLPSSSLPTVPDRYESPSFTEPSNQ